jgi:hypothetical protein
VADDPLGKHHCCQRPQRGEKIGLSTKASTWIPHSPELSRVPGTTGVGWLSARATACRRSATQSFLAHREDSKILPIALRLGR